jgi:hypothetical protein
MGVSKEKKHHSTSLKCNYHWQPHMRTLSSFPSEKEDSRRDKLLAILWASG